MELNANSKVLVTGANGFIGTRLVLRLLQKQVQVFSLVRSKDNANSKSNIVLADLGGSNIELPDENFDVVYHLASLTPHEKNKRTLEKINFEGTKNLFGVVKDRTKSIVYVSGLTVFDSIYDNIDENTPINPDTFYTKLRVKAQRYLEEQCRKNKIDFTVAHVGDIVYGDGGFFMSDMIGRLKKNRFRIPGNGMYFKNYVHVEDVVGALIAMIESGKTNQSFIVTGSNPATFKEFVNFIASQLEIKNPHNIPEFLAKLAIGKDIINLLTRSVKASNDKIKMIYDFQYPQYQDGLREVFDKYKQ